MPSKPPVQRRVPVAGAAEAQVNTQAQLTDPREVGPQNSAFIGRERFDSGSPPRGDCISRPNT
jgi:hypothetical protein